MARQLGISMAFWLAAALPPAQAAVIYDNGAVPPYDRTETSDPSDVRFRPEVAARFELGVGQGVVTGVRWSGIYANSNDPGTDAFTLQFFDDTGSGTPTDTPFLSLAIGAAASRADTGTDLFGADVYRYGVDIAPIVLAPGTSYWLSILNDTPSPSTFWAWAGDEADGVAYARRLRAEPSWERIVGVRLDFQLTDDAPGKVPEPGVLALVGLGLGAIGWARRRSSALPR